MNASLTIHDLQTSWPMIVGADIAQHSEPVEFTGDTLLVAVDTNPWAQQLSFLGDRLLSYVGPHIQKIRFRIGILRAT